MEEIKVSQHINDFMNDNLRKLESLFPSSVKDGKVDFESLKEELGVFPEVTSEKYEFTWAGKKDAKKKAQEDVIGRTLKYFPNEGINSNKTENLYIEGDNLEALKLIRQNYYGSVKMIYIDPPYNTGNDFVYNDNFLIDTSESDEAEGYRFENERFSVNSNSSNRYHAKWLNMMYPRIRVAKDFLTDDGVIFISIDDNELYNLKMLCDEIFGVNCFVADVSWQRTYSMRNDAKGIASEVEHILVYSKMEQWEPHKLPRTEEMDAKYKNPDNDTKGAWRNIVASAPNASTHQGMVYAIQNPLTGEYCYPPQGRCWALGQEFMLEAMNKWCAYKLEELDDKEKRAQVCGVSADSIKPNVLGIVLSIPLEEAKKTAQEIYDNKVLPEFYFSKNGMGALCRKAYLSEVGGRPVTNLWPFEETGHTDEASRLLKELFGGEVVFDTPKPARLLERMLSIATENDSVVMDFFSGSATLADAVMQKNAEDGGNRSYILVQIPEKSRSPRYENLCEIGKERIRRVGMNLSKTNKVCDIGFKVFKVADSNIKWNSLISSGQLDFTQIESTPDMMDFMPGTNDIDVVYEIMLRQRDIPLSEKIDKLSNIGDRTYLYADAYLICLESELTTEMIDKMAAIDPVPVKYVSRDSAFKDDIALKDETFRRLKAVIEKNTNQAKQTYTVEFI